VGGLHIIGTERHESRRIDNQLRGRAGRQGDPGSSRFYVSMEDELMQRFGGDRVKGLMEKLSPEDDIPIDMGIITKQIEGAQRRVEAHNFDIRKHVLEYDDVMNKQREIIYGQRRRVLMGEDVHGSVMDMVQEAVGERVARYCASEKPAEWDIAGMCRELRELTRADMVAALAGKTSRREVQETVEACTREAYARQEQTIGEAQAGVDMREVERVMLLRAVDSHWMDHIDGMDQLRQGIGLQAIGQKDPVVAYRNAGFDMFDEMVVGIREQTVRSIFHVVVSRTPIERKQVATPLATSGDAKPQPKRGGAKVGRNDPCPCGRGKKYKNCCGK